MMRELGLLNTTRKWGARNLKESLSCSIIPLASPWWSFGFLTIAVSS